MYQPPLLPCRCGASLKVPLLRGGVPVQVRFRSWEDSWLAMRCPKCGRSEQWPQPEFTCNCGATVRLPVDPTPRVGSSRPGPGPHPPSGPPPMPHGMPPGGLPYPLPRSATAWRAPFRPQPVRTSEDAVMAAARFLEWLGFDGLELSEAQERDGVCLLGRRLVAQVDVWTEPADLRAVEMLWLATLHAEESVAAMFTLAGYSREAQVRAEQLLVALFTLDPAGLPEPANGAAETLVRTGATS
ncbi:hypothetical protein C7M71_005460 [Peterkaempfera bronchialis]|uniref:Uncharacterized protein n=1 Tax=Peterkaempfera bronchialis TaxID=2126346 RepID=A0A345T5D7_9ACTN|nr:hypothetical protein C7M71_005460 [Peterkaempfera bronchialis]